ncbi:hypothetical protein EC973_006114 [Apophysomyces ossiformis]|uniref:Uncharacterized protein n=1 Tax=Apophysomyces ossiformis TaxID=679940 RepID=A0A8H7BWL6_9FUNG|nr:hypothetical protein EC973_006114 [Apophysomyces ossiformis]
MTFLAFGCSSTSALNLFPGRGIALLRAFSSSAVASNEPSIVHRSLPYLHSHPITTKDGAPTTTLKYALSYLSSKDIPSGKRLCDHPDVVIGWTPEQSSIDPRTFVGNDVFVDFLHRTLAENIHSVNDPSLKGLAKWQKEGWLHIADERNPPPWGRIPSPEDIIGSVLVKNGVIQGGTYQPMPAHRLVTSNGIFQLSEPLTQCMIRSCKALFGK